MKLTEHEQSKLRRALSVVVDQTPIGRPFDTFGASQTAAPRSRPRRLQGLRTGAVAFLVIVAVILPVRFLMFNGEGQRAGAPSDSAPPPAGQTSPPTAVSSTTSTLPWVSDYDAPPTQIVRSLEGTDTVVALRGCAQPGACDSAWLSADGGATWQMILASKDRLLDLIGFAPDGAILAFTNSNDIIRGTLGNGSVVNGAPQVHRFDADSGQWETVELVRPDLPVPGLAPITADSGSDCPITGLHNWVDAAAVAVGHNVVVLGDQRVVGEGICDETFQVVWTSPDGRTWSQPTKAEIDGYASSMFWYQDRYVAYGSDSPKGNPETWPAVWSSLDGLKWDSILIPALPDLPEGSNIWVAARTDWSIGPGNTIIIRYPVWHYRSPIDSSVTDIDGLRAWFTATTGSPPPADMDFDRILEGGGIDFPLDETEIGYLQSLFDQTEIIGQVIFTSPDGVHWETTYRANAG